MTSGSCVVSRSLAVRLNDVTAARYIDRSVSRRLFIRIGFILSCGSVGRLSPTEVGRIRGRSDFVNTN